MSVRSKETTFGDPLDQTLSSVSPQILCRPNVCPFLKVDCAKVVVISLVECILDFDYDG